MKSANKANKFADLRGVSHGEWLTLRKKGIGGSDAAAILGLNPWKSPVAVWAEKTGLSQGEQTENERMWLGNILEEHVRQRFTAETGKKVIKPNFMFSHPEQPFMLANVDGIVRGERSGLEIKVTSEMTKINYEDGEIPPYHYVQCMHYMSVTGLDKWYLATLVLGKKLYIFEITRSESEIEALIDSESRFWNNNVLGNVMPTPDGSESTARIIASRFSKASDQTVQLIEADDLCGRYMEIESAMKALEKEKEEIKQSIQMQLGEASRGETLNYLVSWPLVSGRTSVDSKLLKQKYQDIYVEVVKQGNPSRRFSIKQK